MFPPPTYPANWPTPDQQKAALQALFGDKQKPSPAPSLQKIALAQIQTAEAKLADLQNQATSAYFGVLTANPAILTSPTQVQGNVWANLVVAANVMASVGIKLRELKAFETDQGEWWANNQGSLSPATPPVFPADLGDL